MPTSTPFNVEQMYQKYLVQVGLSEQTMHPDQKRETRQAFYAGFSVCHMTYTVSLPELDDDDAIAALESLQDQCNDFWSQFIGH